MTIRSVGPDGIRVNDELWCRSIAVTPDKIYPDWPAKNVSVLSLDDFSMLTQESPELVLLGTGVKNVFPPRELVFGFARLGVGLEAMETAAAARTFNVLAGEGRRVAAILIHDDREYVS